MTNYYVVLAFLAVIVLAILFATINVIVQIVKAIRNNSGRKAEEDPLDEELGE